MSEEFRKKASERMTGNIPWNKGTKGLYVVSEETKTKISNALRGKKYRGSGKRIICDQTQQIFRSIREAERTLNLHRNCIYRILIGEQNNTCYTFKRL